MFALRPKQGVAGKVPHPCGNFQVIRSSSDRRIHGYGKSLRGPSTDVVSRIHAQIYTVEILARRVQENRFAGIDICRKLARLPRRVAVVVKRQGKHVGIPSGTRACKRSRLRRGKRVGCRVHEADHLKRRIASG